MSGPDRIFVFATDESGRHENALAQLAMTRWGAQRSQGKGLVGSSYAIPVRGRDGVHLARERLVDEFEQFKAFARDNPEKQFVLSRIGCDEIGFSDAKIAPQFAQCPPNVVEPGRWLRRRNRDHCVLAIAGSSQCEDEASIAWALEMTMGFSGTVTSFVVGDDRGADAVVLDMLRRKGASVSVEEIDRNLYGGRAVAIRNRMIALPATHVLIMDCGNDAKCAHMRRTAAAEGLEVYEMKVVASPGLKSSDPEVARRHLEEARRLAKQGASRASSVPAG